MEATTTPGRHAGRSRLSTPDFDHQKLYDWREAAGLSREQACVQFGISYPYLAALELGNQVPSVALMIRLAKGYGRDPGELLRIDGGAS